MIKKYWFYVVGLLSIIAIGTALIAEYFFNLEPCKMCLKQREPYYILIGAFIFFSLFRWQKKIWFFLKGNKKKAVFLKGKKKKPPKWKAYLVA